MADTVTFTGVTDGNGGGIELTDLELLVVVTDDSTDVLMVFTDTGASVRFVGIGDGTITSVAALDATDEVEVQVEA